MANSLMELYGGGMVGESNNYQLGGRIASSRRSRDFQGEMRGLRKKQEAANRRKKKSGFLGSLGSFAGGALGFALAGPAGAAIGAGLGRGAGESSYAREDYSGGKYKQETRGDLRDVEDDYRAGIGERALVSGIQAGIMPGVYDKAGSWLKGLGEAGEAATTAANITGAVPEFAPGFGTAPVHEGMAASGFKLPGMPELGAIPSMTMEGFGSGMAGKFGALPTSVAESVAPRLTDVFDPYKDFSGMLTDGMYDIGVSAPRRQTGSPFLASYNEGGLIDYMMPKYLHGGKVHTDTNQPVAGVNDNPLNKPNQYGVNVNALNQLPSGWNMGNVTGGALFGSGQGLAGNQAYQNTIGWGGLPQGGSGSGAGMSGGGHGPGGYGTATGVMGALGQMGMGDVANDPRLQEYLKDLPQFSMGYQQQIGDIYGSAGQQAGGIRGGARQAAGATGFAGSGAVQAASQKAFGQLGTETARQRRGVVEGYQADLLSAISDIEEKGEFEFGTEEEEKEKRTIEDVYRKMADKYNPFG